MKRMFVSSIFLIICIYVVSYFQTTNNFITIPVSASAHVSRTIAIKLKAEVIQPLMTKQYTVTIDNGIRLKGEAVFEDIFVNAEVREKIMPSGLLQWRMVRIPQGINMQRALKALRTDPNVEIAEMDVPAFAESFKLADLYQNTYASNSLDPTQEEFFSSLWGMRMIHAPEVWEQLDVEAMEPTVVGIVDTGIDISHPDLIANNWINPGEIPNDGIDNDHDGIVDNVNCFSVINGIARGDCYPSSFHCTHVAGIMAAGLNGSGVVGVVGPAGEKVKCNPGQFLGPLGGWVSDAVLVTAHDVASGVKVISHSWIAYEESKLLYDVMKAAQYADCINVVAAGNDGEDLSRFNAYPISYAYNLHTKTGMTNVLGVGAIKEDGSRAIFSNYGPMVRIAAPGQNILSTFPDNKYAFLNGTSMATPHVSGVVGMLRAKFPKENHLKIINRLVYSSYAEPALRNYISGAGILDMRCLTITEDAKPSAVSDIVVENIGIDAITFSFKESSQVQRFEVVYSLVPLNEETLKKGHLVFNVPVPKPDEQYYTCGIQGLSSQTTYYVYVYTLNRLGQRSALKSISVTTH